MKPIIKVDALPNEALLRRHEQGSGYTDCYYTRLEGRIGLAAYVEAFYTTWVFKLERLVLAGFLNRRSTDLQAGQLASGVRERFAAWHVEEREANQLLMRDMSGRTRTWLMVAPPDSDEDGSTCLFLGSAIVPRIDDKSGRERLGTVYRGLIGFHGIYSRVLLRAARSRLERSRNIGDNKSA